MKRTDILMREAPKLFAWSLILIAGYCLGGRIGLGIAALFLAWAQLYKGKS